MLSVKVNYTDNISKLLKKQKAELKKLPKAAIAEYKALTPIRTGNARRRTTLHGDVIEANYPYAERLDEGYSNQAPEGLTKPFNEWFTKQFRKIFGK